MSKFWKKQLPAFLLAMVLVLGMAPAAMAEGEWETDADYHWHEGLDSDGFPVENDRSPHRFSEVVIETKPTCFQKGTGYQVCSVCGYKKSVELDPTGDHKASDKWSSNEMSHWHDCTATDGCREHLQEAKHEFTSGEYESNADYHWQNCDICGGSSSKKDHTDSNGDGVCDVCKYGAMPVTSKVTVTFKNGSSEYAKQDIVKGSKPTKPGTPTMSATNKTYTFKGWVSGANTKAIYTGQALIDVASTTVSSNTTYSAAYIVSAKSQNSSAEVSGDTSGSKIGTGLRTAIQTCFNGVTGTTFTSVRFTSLSSSTYGKLYTTSSKGTVVSASSSSSYSYSSVANFYFVPTSKDTFSISYTASDDYGNTVSGTITLNVGSSTTGETITLTVKPGSEVAFSASKFQAAYKNAGNTGTIRYVTFETSDTLSTSKGTVYYNYDASGEKAFTASTIEDYSFYYSSSSKSYGDYALGSLSFVAPKGASNRTVELTYRACYSSDDYVEGTVKIKISGTASSSGDISYTVKPGSYKNFSKSNFKEIFDDSDLDGTFRYVTFSTNDTLSTSKGTVYYNYDDSGEKAFTASSIEDYEFYYSSKSYGDYALESLSFVAPKGASSRTVELDFRIYDSYGDYVSGTLTIKIGDGGSSNGDISYTVKPDSYKNFSKSDFKKIFDDSDLDGTFRYVTFSTNDTLSTSKGTIYYNYDASGEKAFTASTIEDYSFYYSSKSYGDYALDSLSFVAPKGASSRTVELDFRIYDSYDDYVSGTLTIKIGDGGSSDGDITYKVAANKEVSFDEDDFNDVFQEEYPNYTIKYVTFSTSDTLSTSEGTVYYDYGYSGEKAFNKSTIDDYKFYYGKNTSSGDYALDDLSFVAGKNASDHTVELSFRAYYSSTKYVDGTLVIEVGKGGTASGDISYKVAPGKTVAFDEDDFQTVFRKEESGTIRWVEFTAPTTLTSAGTIYYNYGLSSQKSFSRSALNSTKFYYGSSSSYGDYALDDLSFVASSSFSTAVSIPFRACYSDSRYVDGTLVLQPEASTASGIVGNIRYATTTGTKVQINANDIARFFSKACPGYTMQYVTLGGVPATGSLYYNYYGASKYGAATKTQITSSNRTTLSFYASPSTTSQYALTELTYVPSGTNYCTAIPFTAYGSSRSVSGAILISVNNSVVAEVYGVTPKNTAVSFSSGTGSVSQSIYNAVLKATGSALGSIQLLSLPASTTGAVYVGSGTTSADTSTRYTYNGTMSQLRFVPASNYTGNVEIPYVALNSSGTAIATGALSLGVVNSKKTFTDVTSSTWCYKYVAELSDANVIAGYSNGSFKPDSTVTYGAALKLIMLAAGYSEQKPTTSNVFSGYLAKARADGIITRSNVDLTKPITRLQVAQLAAGAMKLNTSNLSTVQPFTDTTDASVRALNAAGIVEGYFSNGTSTYKPNNTLTRGQVSAIVWRMRNYKK